MIDIHLGPSRDVAAKSASLFQIEEGVHSKVFCAGGVDKSKFLKLSKIADYYADSSFITEELAALIKEIDEIITHHPNDLTVINALHKIRSICDVALKTDQCVFCFAD